MVRLVLLPLAVVGASGAAALVSGCGLQYLPYLSAPVNPQSFDNGDYFQFTRTTDNTEAEFLGFELYYKFYPITDSPDNTITDIGGLAFAGFHRLSSSTDKLNLLSRPLIAIPAANTSEILFTLDFGVTAPLASNDYVGADDPADVTLRRGVFYGSGSFSEQAKHFEYNKVPETYLEADADIGSDVWAAIGIPRGDIRLALYVLSYGKKDFTVDLYSDAVYLGFIEVNFGW